MGDAEWSVLARPRQRSRCVPLRIVLWLRACRLVSPGSSACVTRLLRRPQVVYLKELPKLKALWLADNPCAKRDGYRLAILRALPHLQKLDNAPVESEEVQKAMIHGEDLVHPLDALEVSPPFLPSPAPDGPTHVREIAGPAGWVPSGWPKARQMCCRYCVEWGNCRENQLVLTC